LTVPAKTFVVGNHEWSVVVIGELIQRRNPVTITTLGRDVTTAQTVIHVRKSTPSARDGKFLLCRN